MPPHSETVTYRQVGDLAIQADVSLPAGEGPYPVVLFIHGGALIMGSRNGIDPRQREWYLQDGFAVVSIDYRLAPETKLEAIVSDLDAAVAWVRGDCGRRFDLDPGRVIAVGHSAGGYLALLAGARAQPRLQTVVSFYGYGDLIGAWYALPDPFYLEQPLVDRADALAGVGPEPIANDVGLDVSARYRFYVYCRQNGLWPQFVADHDPIREARAFTPYCLVQLVDSTHPPTLLLHGDRDTDVPYEQSVLMTSAFRAAGVSHELITIDGGGHGFDSELDRRPVAEAFVRVRAFLKHDAASPGSRP